MRIYLSEKNLLEFSDLPLITFRNSGENKLSPWKFCKICDTPWKFQGQKFHGNSIWVVLEQPWEFHFFFNWSLEFPHDLSSVPLWKFDVLTPSRPHPPCLDFFWNSPILIKIQIFYDSAEIEIRLPFYRSFSTFWNRFFFLNILK